ncbi:MAG: 2-C-methyl-D-erythritol 2,4-cyclodiphosphate synthase [Pseudomonadota bacterium]
MTTTHGGATEHGGGAAAGRVAAVIVAAGAGVRAGGGIPKQYRPIAGRSALSRCLEIFARSPRIHHVLTAIRADEGERYEAARAAACSRLVESEAAKIAPPVHGGAERQETVRKALERLADAPRRPALVAIHDAARPFLAEAILTAALDAAARHGAACVAAPVVDTLRQGIQATHDSLPQAGDLVSREGLWRAQTPQVFEFDAILAAHRAQRDAPATDDAEIARRAGLDVALSPGAPELMKITETGDFAVAEALARRLDPITPPAADDPAEMAEMREMSMTDAMRPPPPAGFDVRMGQGFDVHAFGPNADGSSDHVMLCGVQIPHETGLIGHSDADVGLHALTDAVLGAAALGDIGAHFPPSDPQWRGAASDQFLVHALRLARAAGATPTLLDVTMICEQPKIRPHVERMRARIAEIAEMEVGRISVKATTSERLGFTGRGEGVAALASATLVFGAPSGG